MALFFFKEPEVMPVNPIAGDADAGPSVGRYEQREAAGPEIRVSPRKEPEEQPAEEIEEPGYGHGV